MVKYNNILIEPELRIKKFRLYIFLMSLLSLGSAFLIIYFFNISIYSLAYLSLGLIGFFSSSVELIFKTGYPSIFLSIYGSNFMMPHSMLIICAATHKQESSLTYLLIFALIYMFIMYYREYRSIINNKKFDLYASRSIIKNDKNQYFAKSDVIDEMFHLSFGKRDQAWILKGWKGKLQILFIIIMFLLLTLSFQSGYVESTPSDAHVPFSFFVIILSFMGRPMFLRHLLIQKVRKMRFNNKI
jgi:hypothetical protein